MEYQTKLNKKYMLVFILFQALKALLIKRYSYQFFISGCFLSAFTSTDTIFTTFQNLIQHYLKKHFVANFPFFDRLTPTSSNPLNDQNPLSMTKFFLLSFIWQPHNQLWVIVEGAASLTQCYLLPFTYSDPTVTRSLQIEIFFVNARLRG